MKWQPSWPILCAKRFNGDPESRRALRVGQAESRADLPQGRGVLGHRPRRCHWSGPTESERREMRIRDSRPLRNGAQTAKSISVGRFRPVAVSGGVVAGFRGPIRGYANSLGNGAPAATRTRDPRLRRPCVPDPKTGLNLQILRPAFGYIKRSYFAYRDGTSGDNPPTIRAVWLQLESEAITDRRAPIEFAPDFP